MSEKQELLTTNRKALTINLDGTHYGTFGTGEALEFMWSRPPRRAALLIVSRHI